MSRPPNARASQASGLAPPPPNIMQPMRGSSIFAPTPPSALGPPVGTPGPPTSRPGSRMEPPPLSSTMGPMPGTLQNPIEPRRKRLIVTCDGTWLDSDNGILNGRKQGPSNVSRIGWAIRDTSRDGFSQVVHYQAGVGTHGGRISRFFGGALGVGLKENVREAYTYLAVNWHPGDEIFLMGFSRGAFTARSVAGMLGDMGLLTRTGLPFFGEIFEDYENRHDPDYVPAFPDAPFPEKGSFDAKYVAKLEQLGMTRLRVPIKAVCCWDTVGSLGIPQIPLLEKFGIQTRDLSKHQFYDTRLNPYIENAFQALALDEHRGPFSPALWEKKDSERVNLKQVWFPGVHSNIGGGYDDADLANITLAWMMSRLEPFLDFRSDFLISQYEDNQAYYRDTGQKRRYWSWGEIYNSARGVYGLISKKTRTPGAYYRMDPLTGQVTTKKLRNTNEYFHASVRARLGMKGPGYADRGTYDPAALRDWTFAPEPAPARHGQGGNADGMTVVWTNHRAEETGGQDKIPEAIMLESELTLLRNSPRVEEYIRTLKAPVKDRRRRRTMNGADPTMVSGAVPPSADPGRRDRSRPRSMVEPSTRDRMERRRKRRSHAYD
jgi:uncharacterized protein (DUF2235 family)